MTSLNQIKKRIFVIIRKKDKDFKWTEIKGIEDLDSLRKVMEKYEIPEEMVFLRVFKV